jgi:hypothetical protein
MSSSKAITAAAYLTSGLLFIYIGARLAFSSSWIGVLPFTKTNFMWRLLMRRTPCARVL